MYGTLEHGLDTKQFLEKLREVCALGEPFYLLCPSRLDGIFVPYDYWRFTPSSMDHLLMKPDLPAFVYLCQRNSGTVACYKIIALVLPLMATNKCDTDVANANLGLCLAPALVFAVLANVSLSGAVEMIASDTVIAQRASDTKHDQSSL